MTIPETYAIARYINGISLNGFEYVLDNDGDVMIFLSVNDAIDYCTEKNIALCKDYAFIIRWSNQEIVL